MDFELDKLDHNILSALVADARVSFSDLAVRFKVSDGTIHVRVNKLKAAGVLKGTTAVIDHKLLGFAVRAFVGINLEHARDYESTLQKLRELKQITEAYYTTGGYNILVHVRAQSMDDFYHFLVRELQVIRGVQSTETLLILDAPIERC